MSLRTVYMCPTDKRLQCSCEGASDDILDHFIMEHEELLLHSSEVDIYLDLTTENRLLFLDEEIYLIQLRIENEMLKIGLRYLGPKKIAQTISYDIVLNVDGQKYFYNYFENEPSIFEISQGFWIVNLRMLKLLHRDMSVVQCNFSISSKSETVEVQDVGNEYLDSEEGNRSTVSTDVEELSDQDTLIRDDEIDDILRETVVLRNSKEGCDEGDALDNISSLNFSLLENSSRYCRRYSSFLGIPQELFDEKETTNLSCSNCLINMLPPIYFCINNHNICADCRYESCKICYESVTDNRNRELEEYSRKCLHLCRYHIEGCMESFMYNEIRNHEIKCIHCIYKCLPDCSFTGKFHEFYSHFKIKHPSCKIFYSTPVDFPRNSEFFVCDGRLGIFHCTSTFSKNTVRWIVVFMGPRDRNFSCEITFKGARTRDVLFLRRLEDQYSVAQTKEDLKKLKVKDKNAQLTITSYFQ